MQTDYDILVVGGGMVGATFACALGGSRFRIGVVESAPADPSWPRADYDNRVSAITRATQRVFQNVGAWDNMVRRRVQPYRKMHVWDATGSGAIHFDAAEIGEPDLGLIVENTVILAGLLERMREFDNIELLCPAKVRALNVAPDQVSLDLEDGRHLTARLVIGADGATSWVREQAGITTHGWRYDQSAVVAIVKTSLHHGEACYQRFMPTGPLAFLAMPDGLSAIVWSTSPEQAETLTSMPEREFLDALQAAFGDTLGRMESTGPRGAWPLQLRHADHYVQQRIALMGNAAHAIHPLAGQGLNLGVSDAAALAQVLEEAEGEDIGHLRVLRRYERWRKADNLAVMAAMDGFKRLFSNDVAPLALLRNAGMRLTNAVSPVKNLMVRRAMGLGGKLPRLTRPLIRS